MDGRAVSKRAATARKRGRRQGFPHRVPGHVERFAPRSSLLASCDKPFRTACEPLGLGREDGRGLQHRQGPGLFQASMSICNRRIGGSASRPRVASFTVQRSRWPAAPGMAGKLGIGLWCRQLPNFIDHNLQEGVGLTIDTPSNWVGRRSSSHIPLGYDYRGRAFGKYSRKKSFSRETAGDLDWPAGHAAKAAAPLSTLVWILIPCAAGTRRALRTRWTTSHPRKLLSCCLLWVALRHGRPAVDSTRLPFLLPSRLRRPLPLERPHHRCRLLGEPVPGARQRPAQRPGRCCACHGRRRAASTRPPAPACRQWPWGPASAGSSPKAASAATPLPVFRPHLPPTSHPELPCFGCAPAFHFPHPPFSFPSPPPIQGHHMDRLLTVAYLPTNLATLALLMRSHPRLPPRRRIPAGLLGYAAIMGAVPLQASAGCACRLRGLWGITFWRLPLAWGVRHCILAPAACAGREALQATRGGAAAGGSLRSRHFKPARWSWATKQQSRYFPTTRFLLSFRRVSSGSAGSSARRGASARPAPPLLPLPQARLFPPTHLTLLALLLLVAGAGACDALAQGAMVRVAVPPTVPAGGGCPHPDCLLLVAAHAPSCASMPPMPRAVPTCRPCPCHHPAHPTPPPALIKRSTGRLLGCPPPPSPAP